MINIETKASLELTDPSFEINFDYNHPYITTSSLNVFLDHSGFIYQPEHLNNSDDSPNDMWIGSTPECLQDLIILEQLLISLKYPYMNLMQIMKRRYTHHKHKGHIVTLPQNPSSLIN
ncbi:9114_t:CDS:2, partial [Scutellospora calospora]